MPPHPLKRFEIQKYYQSEPEFNGTYSKNGLFKIKDRAYVKNLHEFKSRATHSIVSSVNRNNITYFDSFRVAIIQ